ncbi:glycosyltransferase family 2 protein [Sphingomonas crocodyli]|uniref:Glycosyltransferase family 2 protein n=1 Tax=Sphingomonas crocodyli TaxID=1979270 RepID=A0A437LYN0_9SPHN|nr:glycosyltransferase family 2 protein [Sphingomonas crocodyli]RVT90520.1 glycosyltransferase family 2 protein [Sphingomonas crocodyli]
MNGDVPSFRVDRWLGKTTRYCCVIPVINEGEQITRQLAKMRALGISKITDIIIVDGGSKDGSLDPDKLDAGEVRALVTKTAPGKLSAQLRCAYAFALDEGYEGIVTIDGNDKDDPDAIPAFVKALDDGYDFAQASRFIPGGVEENTPKSRRLAIKLIHAPALSIASGFHWTDTTQGFRAYSAKMLLDPRVSIFRDVFGTYELLAYLNYRAPKLGYRCIELPTARRYPANEKVPTKISPWRGQIELMQTLFKACTGGFNP